MTVNAALPEARRTGARRVGLPRRETTRWVLRALLCVFFVLASGLPKLVGEHTAVSDFHEIGWGDWFRYLTGVLEISGGVGLVIPRLTRLAAGCLSALTVCAALTQVFLLHAPALAVFPLALAALFAWLARG
jgi:uncharacterized membrane protein YphA (DoxX/SURF4 family)